MPNLAEIGVSGPWIFWVYTKIPRPPNLDGRSNPTDRGGFVSIVVVSRVSPRRDDAAECSSSGQASRWSSVSFNSTLRSVQPFTGYRLDRPGTDGQLGGRRINGEVRRRLLAMVYWQHIAPVETTSL